MFCDDLENWLNIMYEGCDIKDEIVGWHSQYIYELLLLRDMDYDTVAQDLLKASIEVMNASSGGPGLLFFARELNRAASNIETRVKHAQSRIDAGVGMPSNQNMPSIPAE